MEDLFGHRISHPRLSITDQCHERRHHFMPGESQTWRPAAEMPTCREILRTVRTGTPLAAGFRQVKLNRVLMKNRHTGAGASGSANPDDDDDDNEEEDEDPDDDGNGDDNGDSSNSLPTLLNFAHN